MKKAREQRPADFVRAALPDERLWELWDGIERGEARVRTRGRRLRQAAASAALLGGVWLVAVVLGPWWARPSPRPEAFTQRAPAPAVASHGAPRQLSLSDGSTLSLGDEARADVVAMTPVEVRVRLEHGSVECEVPAVPQRRFVVEAAGFEVVVTGTHFTVTLGTEQALPTGVTVSVERGSVEVREAPDKLLARLGAGQHWASERNGAAPVPPAALTEALPEARLPEARLPEARLPLPLAPVAPPALVVPVAPQSARALFERANAARLAGNTAEAAAAFDELRRRYPTDVRAGYAAFMLGRLRLDTLQDPSGAADAFSFAIAHPGSGFFLEDAEARRVEALAKAGRFAECRQAQSRFASNHPQSARAGLVAKQCDAR